MRHLGLAELRGGLLGHERVALGALGDGALDERPTHALANGRV